MQAEMETLRFQLTTARNEINKLRQQVRNLTHLQRKEFEKITNVLADYRCEGCRQAGNNDNTCSPCNAKIFTPPSGLQLNPIGVIRTSFPEKRAVPRQASVGGCLRGIVELNSDVFNNPEHALEGLEEYSHMWLIYYFDRNNAHPKAKVAPPRLDGERVGVFSTRSPHRPCPIGLSLVEIERIENANISFYGTDMVDGTPLLDIKPYIPYYDAPFSGSNGRISVDHTKTDFYDSRQEPDGEESHLDLLGAGGNNGITSNNHALPPQPQNAVKVPNWIVASHRLKVVFNERAESQLHELQVNKQCIVDILEGDPRSVYLRTRYGSQIFTFQLSEVTVTCKFDDKASTVTVVQIRRNENVQDDESVIEQ